jgi:hypothetical protein
MGGHFCRRKFINMKKQGELHFQPPRKKERIWYSVFQLEGLRWQRHCGIN